MHIAEKIYTYIFKTYEYVKVLIIPYKLSDYFKILTIPACLLFWYNGLEQILGRTLI